MSRVGKAPVAIPDGVKVGIEGNRIAVEGPKGKLEWTFHPEMGVVYDEEKKQVRVERPSDLKRHKALHGLTRALINNMVRGVVDPYEKRLIFQGVGYGAGLKQGGKILSVSAGFSHDVELEVPEGIEVEILTPQNVLIRGCDKQKVGEFAARVRRIRPPEPYNAKGIRYGKTKDQPEEIVRRKAGKAFGS
ncbi:MAG: 50S ribosomal protein L6 [Planctomycetota bacterium]|nr:MAG: 50S ribosomal protein L6 [Planctomycetota bacterium]